MSQPSPQAQIRGLFDPVTGTVTHVVWCATTRQAAVIDSVRDYDPKSGRSSRTSADQVLALVQAEGLQVLWHLETHAHADHLSAAPLLQQALGGRIGIGARIREVQQAFKPLFNLAELTTDGSPFDHLFEDGERFALGHLQVEVLHTPGHTPACVSYRIGDDVFVGDTLFMPDFGTARCDFPGGDARTLYRSIQRLLRLPGHTRLHLCHDYPQGREPGWVCTVDQQRADNIHVRQGSSEDGFAAVRSARDATLAMPVLLLPSIQVNVRAGQLPEPEDNGIRYLKIPLDAC